MAIPKDILAVQRPSSTVVKQRGTRFVVVKRTSKRVGNRVVPVDIGTVINRSDKLRHFTQIYELKMAS